MYECLFCFVLLNNWISSVLPLGKAKAAVWFQACYRVKQFEVIAFATSLCFSANPINICMTILVCDHFWSNSWNLVWWIPFHLKKRRLDDHTAIFSLKFSVVAGWQEDAMKWQGATGAMNGTTEVAKVFHLLFSRIKLNGFAVLAQFCDIVDVILCCKDVWILSVTV